MPSGNHFAICGHATSVHQGAGPPYYGKRELLRRLWKSRGWGGGRLTGARLPPKVSKVNDGEEQSLWGSRESGSGEQDGQSPAHDSLGLSWRHPHVPQKLSQWHPWACPSLAS